MDWPTAKKVLVITLRSQSESETNRNSPPKSLSHLVSGHTKSTVEIRGKDRRGKTVVFRKSLQEADKEESTCE